MHNTEERIRKYQETIKPVADELRKIGLEIKKGDFTHLQAKNGVVLSLDDMGLTQNDDDLQYLTKKYGPLEKNAVDILLKWIPEINFEPALVVLISQLSRTKVKYNGNVLLDVFKQTNISLVRERIGFVLEESNPEIDLQELANILSDTKYDQDITSLILAGIKLLPKDKINPILVAKFNDFPLIVLRGLRKTGGKVELEFLEAQLSSGNLDKKLKKEADATIEKIRSRLKSE